MRTGYLFVAFILLSALNPEAQETTPATPTHDLAEQSIHYAEPGVTAPEMPSKNVSISSPKHCSEINGMVRLSAVVDAGGNAHNLEVIQSDDPRLGTLAVKLIRGQRFKPGTYDGVPASVAISLTVALQTCEPNRKQTATGEENELILRTHPLIATSLLPRPAVLSRTATTRPADGGGKANPYQVGGDVSAPFPFVQTDPPYPAYAKRKRITGVCLLGAVIDADGFPRDVHVVKSLDPSLDNIVIGTVKTWRFKPALKDGSVPVPAEVTIEASFRRFAKAFVSFAEPVAASPGEVLACLGEHRKCPVSDLSACVGGQSQCPISPAVPVNFDEVRAEHPQYGGPNKNAGVCVVGALVDINGIPRNVRVIKSVDSDMDESAVYALKQLRFKPAMKDGSTRIPGGFLLQTRFKQRWTLF